MSYFRSGQTFGQSFNRGVGTATLASKAPQGTPPPIGTIPEAHLSPASQAAGPSTLYYLLGIALLLVLIHYAQKHEKSKMEPRLVGVGVYNVIFIGGQAMIFFIAIKLLVNMYPRKLGQLPLVVNAA